MTYTNTNRDFPPQMRADWFEQICGLTDPMPGPPPTVGWWKTQQLNGGLTGRRYWDGTAWSLVVLVGESDADAESCRLTPSPNQAEIMWRGLKVPHPEAEYTNGRKSPRAAAVNEITTKKPQLVPAGRVVLLEH